MADAAARFREQMLFKGHHRKRPKKETYPCMVHLPQKCCPLLLSRTCTECPVRWHVSICIHTYEIYVQAYKVMRSWLSHDDGGYGYKAQDSYHIKGLPVWGRKARYCCSSYGNYKTEEGNIQQIPLNFMQQTRADLPRRRASVYQHADKWGEPEYGDASCYRV